ncbi:MFS transporter [Streptomyces sp. SID4985]|uniref:MFS transporter n=1 Tax=Streptomyces sp. SID4985 TaxID=2690292 RepID=UPI00235109D7|nr:MFS transporter [Streptomyces sp. SID4985]
MGQVPSAGARVPPHPEPVDTGRLRAASGWSRRTPAAPQGRPPSAWGRPGAGASLSDYLSWRWVMFVNVPIGVLVLLGARVLASGEKLHGELDVRGAATATGGLTALVYAITQGGDRGWTDPVTFGMFTVAAILLITFLRSQRRNRHPLLPLRLLRNRNRAGSYVTMLFIGAAMFATFYFLSLFMQQVKGYSPVRAGFAHLPFSLGMGMAAGIGSRLAGRFSPRTLAGPGLVVAAGGMLWFSPLEPSSSYFTHLMPAMFITALGLGASFLPMTLGAISGVDRNDTGIASAILNTAQQIGGAVGLAVLATVSTSAADDQLPHADVAFFRALASGDQPLIQRAADALSHGYTVAFASAVGFLLAALVITVTTLNASPQQRTEDAAPVHIG